MSPSSTQSSTDISVNVTLKNKISSGVKKTLSPAAGQSADYNYKGRLAALII